MTPLDVLMIITAVFVLATALAEATGKGPQIGDTVAIGESRYRVINLRPANKHAEVEAVLVEGPARDQRVAFALQWLTRDPDNWRANSALVLP